MFKVAKLGRSAVVALLLATLAAAGLGQVDREAELEQIRGEIVRLKSRLNRVGQRRNTLSEQLEATRLEVQLQEQELAEAIAARELASERVGALEERVGALEEQLAQVRSSLRRRIVGLYRLGRLAYLRLFFSVTSESSLLPAIRQLRYLARRDDAAMDGFLDTRVRLEVEAGELAKERRRVELWVGQEETRRTELTTLEAEQRRLLAEVEAERRTLESRRETLEDRERKLSSFLDFLVGRATGELAGEPMTGFRGVLDWPVTGDVTVGFGPRSDPRYQTQVPHHGVELATRAGDEVKAIYPGTVLYAAPFQGYGLTVIVHHPGGVFSLYAGLAELRAAKDDVLSLGEVIGAASDSLYLEIRADNRPEDPRRWLR